jgi:hypothetical protein
MGVNFIYAGYFQTSIFFKIKAGLFLHGFYSSFSLGRWLDRVPLRGLWLRWRCQSLKLGFLEALSDSLALGRPI